MERPKVRSRFGLQARRAEQCGCVPQVSLVSYEDLAGAAREEQRGGRGWAKRFPLLGPLWCVAGTTRDRVMRRRDNAVYRSNSFKFEKRGPQEQIQQKIEPAKVVFQESVQKMEKNNQKKHINVVKQLERDLRVDVNYSDPQDADQKETWEEPVQSKELYRLKLGQDIYYCRPYQAFHTQLRYNFSDLLETGVDSEYEEMVNNVKVNNKGVDGACHTCVTVIPVCAPVPSTRQNPSCVEPPYENIPLHKVTISVPYVGTQGTGLHRIPPLRKSKVPLKYQGIKRVKTKARPQPNPSAKENLESGDSKAFEKYGYSKNEVWKWLYPENDGDGVIGSVAIDSPGTRPDINDSVAVVTDLYSVSTKKKAAVASVEFSTGEFLAANHRLQHLDLEGLDQFVGSTIDRAVTKVARTARNNHNHRVISDTGGVNEQTVPAKMMEEKTGHGGDTDVYVGREAGAGCEACVTGGHSSCSSALSSLESGRSSQTHLGQGLGSCDSDSSAIGSMNSRVKGNDNYMRMYAPAPHCVPMCAPNMVRGRIRNSLPQLAGHKAYQTLEIGETDGVLTCQHQHVTSQPARTSHKLNLVDTNIQLHRQEWYHGNVSREEAEAVLRLHPPGSYLVRNCQSAKRDYSLSLKSSCGYMHMRIQQTPEAQYVLGQFSKPFLGIPEIINHYTINRLPIKGAQHMCLLRPICEQLL